MSSNRPSYEKINYSIRPAKAIERRMLVEALQKLHIFSPLHTYRYIGFGSTFFSDFSLFHRSLGITKMISIEKESLYKDRFEFNKPFRCIQMEFESSSIFLEKTSWHDKTILWLDYDDKLNRDIIVDIKTVCRNITSGSVMIISFNAHPDRINVNEATQSPSKSRLEILKSKIGEENVPISIKEKDLANWGTARVCHSIVNNIIKDVLRDRNGPYPSSEHILYKQLFNIQYADQAKMLTVGGIFYDASNQNKLEACNFDNLSFVTTDDTAYQIKVPSLTFKEMRYIDTILPVEDISNLSIDNLPISIEDIQDYASIYRYFPAFAETNL